MLQTSNITGHCPSAPVTGSNVFNFPPNFLSLVSNTRENLTVHVSGLLVQIASNAICPFCTQSVAKKKKKKKARNVHRKMCKKT